MTRLPPQPPGNLDHAKASILEPEVTLSQAMLIDYIRMYQAQIDPASRSGQGVNVRVAGWHRPFAFPEHGHQ
jgi:hypothetical protein